MEHTTDNTTVDIEAGESDRFGILDSEISRRSPLVGGLAAVSISLTHPKFHEHEEASAVGRTIKFGYVAPETGPLSAFGAVNAFVIQALKSPPKNGVVLGGVRHPIEVIVKDSQSTDATAAAAANDRIKNDKSDVSSRAAFGTF
jgi:branched-chain amino acid transport system substrate-binding protein